jgi:hypothetical protein
LGEFSTAQLGSAADSCSAATAATACTAAKPPAVSWRQCSAGNQLLHALLLVLFVLLLILLWACLLIETE